MSHEHRFVCIDRGVGHIHRYKAACICGWVFPSYRRRKRLANVLYRDHLEVQTHAGRRRADRHRREPTPTADLPIELR